MLLDNTSSPSLTRRRPATHLRYSWAALAPIGGTDPGSFNFHHDANAGGTGLGEPFIEFSTANRAPTDHYWGRYS